MSRGRPKEEPKEEQPRKYTRVFESADCSTTWHFDLDIARSPIRVDVKWNKTPAQMKAESKQEKEQKKLTKQHNDFFKFKENEAAKTISKSTKQQNKHTSSRGRKK